ncbi:MAG: flagellar hook-basal body complex protein FliE [Myxococcota bacterium]
MMKSIQPPMLTYAPELQAKGVRQKAALEQAYGSAGPSFADRLKEAVQSVNQEQVEADGYLKAVAAGQDVDLHTAMISLEEADISLRSMVSVRDKVVEAYERVMNMSI